MVEKHYEQVKANAFGQVVGTTAPSSPTEIDYFTFFESLPLTLVDGCVGTLQCGLPSPLTYESLDNVMTPTPGQAPAIPSTPTRQGTQPHAPPTSASRLCNAPTSSFQPCGTPSTPTQFNTTFNITSLQTPNCKKKHYSVVVRRHTSIYSSWYNFLSFPICVDLIYQWCRNLAKPMVDGLGSHASFQGFDTYKDASTDYFEAHARGWVRVVRLPSDDEDIFGPIETAEDV